MYKHILVPLDESELAELALPHAKELAKASQARVTLFEVVEAEFICMEPGLPGVITVVEATDFERLMGNARQYLGGVADRLKSEGLEVDTAVRNGDPASWICDYARDEGIDLIVMSTHGRSGIQRWVYGSVADRVLRGASVPVLLVRAYTGESPRS